MRNSRPVLPGERVEPGEGDTHHCPVSKPNRFVEMQIPQAKPWLVRLAPFRVDLRTLRQPGTARERVLAALDAMSVEAGDMFTVRDVYGYLGIVTGTRERGAVQRAIDRMYRGDRGRAPELERVKVGWYRRM